METQTTLELIYLSTPDCRVCQMLRPQVEALVQSQPPWTFTYVNLDREPLLKGRWLVFTVPTLILVIDGKEVRRFSRYLDRDELRRVLQRYAELVDE